MTTGVGGTATGRGGERLICDDPLNPKQAASDADLENAWRWFGRTFQNRLRDKKKGAIVLVMQRLHEMDTTAQALEVGYEHLCIPAEYDPKRSKVTCIGWKDKRQKEGELLWPEHEGEEEINFAKRSMGSYAYAGQYQQTPHPDGGGFFKRSDFRYYRTLESQVISYENLLVKPERMMKYSTIDLAFSKKEGADFTVVGIWGFFEGYLYLLDLVRDRFTETELCEEVIRLQSKWGYYRNWIEKGAYDRGVGLIRYLRSRC